MDLEEPLRPPASADHAADAAAAEIAGLRKRIALNPGSPAPRNKLATLLQAQGLLGEATSLLEETVDRFPRNARAQEQLKALVKHSFVRAAPAPVPSPSPVPPPGFVLSPLKPPPAGLDDVSPEPEWGLMREPHDMPIRLSRWRPRAEWLASAAIVLVLGLVWQAWRLLPEGPLLRKPAIIVTDSVIPPASTLAPASQVVVASLVFPPAVVVQADTVEPAPVRQAELAARPAPVLSEVMPQVVMILYSRRTAASAEAATRLASRLKAQNVPVLAPIRMPNAGQPGFGYFYAEDRPGAEALRLRLPDMDGAVRLISGVARSVQQPGSVAIVLP